MKSKHRKPQHVINSLRAIITEGLFHEGNYLIQTIHSTPNTGQQYERNMKVTLFQQKKKKNPKHIFFRESKVSLPLAHFLQFLSVIVRWEYTQIYFYVDYSGLMFP